MPQMVGDQASQITCILEIDSRIMRLLQTMDFPGKMKILEVGRIDFCDVATKTIHTDDLGTDINAGIEIYPISGILFVPFTLSKDIMSNTAM